MRLRVRFLAVVVLVACGSNGGDDTDSSIPDAAEDTGHDATTQDSSKPDASGADSSTDALADATDEADVAAQDASDDGSVDEGGIMDASVGDGGKKKSCLGVFCVFGDQCCNNLASPNYGKCEPKACLACCM